MDDIPRSYVSESEELFSDPDERIGDFSCSDKPECDKPSLHRSALLNSKKAPRPEFLSVSEKRSGDSTRPFKDGSSYREWLERRATSKSASGPSERTPSRRPHSKESRQSVEPRTLQLSSKTVVNANGDGGGGNDNSESLSVNMLSVLSELNSTVTKLVKRLEKQESCLESIEHKIDSPSFSSSASESKCQSRKKVPVVVRSETRKMYQTLLEEDLENFSGFRIGQGVTFRDPLNQKTTTRLVKEVQGINTSFLAADIRNAAYTYYKTLCQGESLQRRGVCDQQKRQRRRRERIARKLHERYTTFGKLSFAERDREKWEKVFSVDFMSSEESDSSDADVIVVKSLPWRSNRVTSFLHSLDDKSKNEKTPQAKRQMKGRRLGGTSARVQPSVSPDGRSLPSWLLKTL